MSSDNFTCPRCKAKVRVGTKFCPYCMVKIEVAREPEPEVAAPIAAAPFEPLPERREGTGQEDLLAAAARALGGTPGLVMTAGSVLQGYALWRRPDHLVLLTLGFSELGRTADVWPESGRGFEVLVRVKGSEVPEWLFPALDGLLEFTFKVDAGSPLKLLPFLWCETAEVEGLERLDTVNGLVRVVEAKSPHGEYFSATDHEFLPQLPPDDETRRMQVVWTFDQGGELKDYSLCGTTLVREGHVEKCHSRQHAIDRLREAFERVLHTGTRITRTVRERPPRRGLAPYSALEDDFFRARDDEKAAHVYRDWLLEHGDPRGELAAWIEGDAQEELDFFWQHDAEVLLDDWARQVPLDSLEWTCGFVDSCHIRRYRHEDLSNQLRMILELRFLSTIRGLRLDQPELSDLDATWKALAGAPQAPRFTTLSLNESDMLSGTFAHEIAPLFKALPSLLELRIEASQGAFGKLEHPKLHTLAIESTELSKERVKELTKANLPSLTSLEVWTGRDADVALIESLFERRGLTSFGLINCAVTHEALPMLVRAPLFQTLKSLSFAGGGLIDQDVPVLVKAAPELKKLERFDVSDNVLSPESLRTLRRVLPNLISTEQRDAYEYDDEEGANARYVSVAE